MLRRDVTPERLFFLVVLVGALLIISGLMLRQEGTPSTRTFRDGFTVAETESIRRTETVSNATERAFTDATETEADADVRTTTIKTEDGDEITIKRSGTSKGKITTISRHENGKLTIEDTNADEQQEEAEKEVGDEEELEQEQQDEYKLVETESPGVLLEQKNVEEEQKEANKDEGGQVIVSGGKKVTVVQVNSSLTKVSLSDVEEAIGSATR
ncbi:hypothetical protein PHYBOEH_004876 [Phytophthora boehmeriae]|uniref:Uncharacterized protein n=1 Tax=Phytophthora boehmeriae TaxID=109152 RepID=A0A8T1WSA0_9STRA|nr:hypothetical protein PHYBOEH_004876 [Phytophthora boehmeriae]